LEGLQQKLGALSAARPAADRPSRGWLRAVREAVGLTQAEAAARISVKRQSYAQFEAAEEKGSISIASLKRSAEALDCELVYFVVPRGTGASFSDLAQRHDPASMHLRATDQSTALRGGGAQDDAG